MKNTTVVFYDNMDNDGKCSGSIIKQYLEDKDIEPVMVGLDRDLRSNDKDWYEFLNNDTKEVWFTDLRPRKLEDFTHLEAIGEVTIIDHHEFIDLSYYQNIKYIHTTKVSATMIAWKHLYFDRPYEPKVVELVNDRDMWANRLQPYTNYFFNIWKLLDVELFQQLVFNDEEEKLIDGLLEAGRVLEEVKQRKINKYFKTIKIEECNGYKVAYTEIDDNGIISELGNKACKELGVTFYANIRKEVEIVEIGDGVVEEHSTYQYNLRSLNGEALKFIKKYKLNGGGHPNACGFKSSKALEHLLLETIECPF